MVANYYLSALLEIKPPSIMGIPENVEKVLLRGLRLEKSSFGKLEKAQGYTDFAQIADALETII